MNTNTTDTNGWIEVVTGSMFSGKTEELLRRIRRATIAKQHVQVFKPKLDHRYGTNKVTSHAGANFTATPVENSAEIIEKLNDETTVVAVDEAQFFDEELAKVGTILADKGIRVIVAGLDQDFRGDPFGPMPIILSLAEQVSKLHAICVVCGKDASRTQRMIDGRPAYFEEPTVVVGGSESYEARCRIHHDVPHKPI